MKHLVFITVCIFCFLGSNGFADDKKIIIRNLGIGGEVDHGIYNGAAQTEIVSPEGVRVLIDVCLPDKLSGASTSNDILLTTHFHADHFNQDFLQDFSGEKLTVKAGTIKVKDVEIIGIPASHYKDTNFADSFGTDYIFLVIIGGKFRIAHFGDIGQVLLTPEQLSVLGKIDAAVMVLETPLSTFTAGNRNTFDMMDQLKPKLIIPTHFTEGSAEYSMKKWKSFFTTKTEIKIGSSDLNNETKFLFMGPAGEKYGKSSCLKEFQ